MPTSKKTWIGANFWSRSGGPAMWANYDPLLVRSELKTLAEHGLNLTRSFFYWPQFMPAPLTVDEAMVDRFQDFLDAHVEMGMRTIPTFIVGHMSGQNWDPAWRLGRDLYRDTWLVSQQAWFVEEMTRLFASHPAIAAWLLSNEMPLYGGPGSADEIEAWARLLVQAVRAGGGNQPVSTGDGAWGIEVSGRDNGYSVRRLAQICDFLGPHVYPMEDDQVREFFAAAFACEMAGGFGKPVILEEFGVSSDFTSDENASHYYRQVLHSTLLAGASGWIAWNNCDYDGIFDQDPYRHHVFELHFGLTDGEGRPKKQLNEMRRFSELMGGLEAANWARPEPQVALVVPEHMDTALPFTESTYRTDIRDNLFQAYIAAREADLPIGICREREGIPEGRRLYLAPSTKQLTGPGLRRLGELAQQGATVYLSYFAGSTNNQRGPWLTWLGELFGIRHKLRYGLVDPITDEEVVLRFVAPLGKLSPGDQLRFRVSGTPSARSYLPIELLDAELLATDQLGRPALVRKRHGAGASIFCTYPLEHFAARTPAVNPEDTWKLYSALAESAGVVRVIHIPDGRIMVGVLLTDRGRVAILQNTSDQKVEAALELTGLDPSSLTRWGEEGGLEKETIALSGFGVEVLVLP